MGLTSSVPYSILQPGVCTSTTRPASPYHGQVVFETDTQKTLFYNGTAWVILNDPNAFSIDSSGNVTFDNDVTVDGAFTPNVGYLYVQTLYFTTVGTATFTKASYPWLRAVKIKVQGGGGGGGGVNAASNRTSMGGGGGAGGYAEAFVLASSLAASETITVGAGGAGGAAGLNNGVAGSASSFGAHAAASGGGAGAAGTDAAGLFGAVNFASTSGVGGAGTAGDLLLRGNAGTIRHQNGSLIAVGGTGGSSLFGGGGAGASAFNSSSAGSNADGPGSGGGGAASGNTATSRAGGSGDAGIVIVELYA